MLSRRNAHAGAGILGLIAFLVIVLGAFTGRRDVHPGMIPPGAILPYVGPLTATLGPNWVLCDGRQINSPGSIFHQRPVPDLTENRFLMGVSAATPVGAGQGAGSNTLPSGGNHTHTIRFNGYAPGEINYNRNQGHQDQFQMQYAAAQAGAHDHGGDNRPAYMPVHFICRIR